jgi:hypothetical protein
MSELKVGSVPGFFQQVEPGEAVGASRGEFNHGQAAAVHGETGPQLQPSTARPGPNRKFDGAGGGFDVIHNTCFFYDAGKHVGQKCRLRIGLQANLDQAGLPCPAASAQIGFWGFGPFPGLGSRPSDLTSPFHRKPRRTVTSP